MMVVPSAFTGTPSNFSSFLEQNGVFFVKNLGRDSFNVNISCLYFICEVGKKVDEIVVQQLGGQTTIKHSIQGCFSEFNKPKNNLGSRWRRGRLNRNAFTPGENEVVEICGDPKSPVTIARVANNEQTTKGMKKVVVNNIGYLTSFGPVKIAPKHAAICYSVVAIVLEDDEDEQYLLDYLQSTFVSHLVSKVKTSNPNSKNCFEYIPNFKFDRPITYQIFSAALY